MRVNALVMLVVVSLASTEAEPLLAGPLDPPRGPVAPTGVTQILELPAIINTPGAYRLARDITMTASVNGITITASNVSIDLDGHVLDGGAIGGEGILLSGSLKGVTIENGTISNWTGAGIFQGFGADTGVVIRNVRCADLGFEGIRLNDSDAMVIECVVSNTAGQGIWVGSNSRVINCKTVSTGAEGILVGSSSVITGCVVEGANQTIGVAGIAGGIECVVENSTASTNNSGGFALGASALMRGCNASNNAAPAVPVQSMVIDTRSGAIIDFFQQSAPWAGKRKGKSVVDPVAGLFTTEGVGAAEGFIAGQSSRIFNCVANDNSGAGFILGPGSSIVGSVASTNGGDGIVIGDDTDVNDNHVSGNFGNGIVLNADGTHCEGNYISVNGGDGIQINDAFAVVIRNHVEIDDINNVAGALLVGPTNDLTNPLSNWIP